MSMRIITDYPGFIRHTAVEAINMACAAVTKDVAEGVSCTLPTRAIVVQEALDTMDDIVSTGTPDVIVNQIRDAINGIQFDINVQFTKRIGHTTLCTIDAVFATVPVAKC